MAASALSDALAQAAALAATHAIELPAVLASSQPLRVAAGEIRAARLRRAIETHATELVGLVEGDADHGLVREGLSQLTSVLVAIETTTLSTFALATLLGAQRRHGADDDGAIGDEVLTVFRATAEIERDRTADQLSPVDDPATLTALFDKLRL